MYNTKPYKSKVIHVEGNILNLSPIIQNRNAYPRKENNCGDDYSMVLLDDEHLSDTITTGNIDLNGNGILETSNSVLFYIHIGLHTGDTKYRIKSRKTETFKNIIVQHVDT